MLCGAYGAQQLWLQQGLDAFAARTVYIALTLFVPFNLAALALMPERGTFNRHGALRLGAILLQAALTAWVATAGQADVIDWAYQKFLDPAPFSAGRIPQLGIALIGLGLLITMAMALVTRSAVSRRPGGRDRRVRDRGARAHGFPHLLGIHRDGRADGGRSPCCRTPSAWRSATN